MRHILAIAALVGVAGAAQAGTFFIETFADSNINGDAPDSATTLGSGRTWNIRSSGPIAGTSGIRFMTIEGSGSFASWGLIEFDPSAVISSLNASHGAGNWVITGATMTVQQQSSQPFSAVNGSLNLIHVADDATSAAGLSGSSFISQLGGATPVVTGFAYTNTPSGVFAFSGGDTNAAVLADWNSGTDLIRMVLNPGSAGVVAPFKGSSSPFAGINAPSFRLSYDVIPTPGAAALFGLAGLAGARRRRA